MAKRFFYSILIIFTMIMLGICRTTSGHASHFHPRHRYLVMDRSNGKIYTRLHFSKRGYNSNPGYYSYNNDYHLNHRSVKEIKKHRFIGQNFYYVALHHHPLGWVYHGNLSRHQNGHHSDFLINAPKLSESTIKRDCHQIVSQSFKDINRDRIKNHVQPLTHNAALDRISRVRAKQLVYDYNHVDHNGQYYFLQDADRMGYDSSHWSWGENISPIRIGVQRNGGSIPGMNDRIYYSPTYYGRNGKELANEINHWYYNYDSGSKWGHRRNILEDYFRQVGIGAYYDPKYRTFYQVEDFLTNNSRHAHFHKQSPWLLTIRKGL